MYQKILSFIFIFFAFFSLRAQVFDFGMEFQVYPTGFIPGIYVEKGFNEKNAVNLRLGYNVVRHGDAGVQDDERGEGFGFTLGYKRYFREGFHGFSAGIRNDFWFNRVEWKNNIGMPDETSGVSKIIVIQPTVQGSYLFDFDNAAWFIAPSLAFGVEINVKTDGEPVGEGLILLGGLKVGKRW